MAGMRNEVIKPSYPSKDFEIEPRLNEPEHSKIAFDSSKSSEKIKFLQKSSQRSERRIQAAAKKISNHLKLQTDNSEPEIND